MPKNIFLIACEASADLHGAHLIEAWKKIDPQTSFRGLGGPQLKNAGMNVLYDMTRISALGFTDVVRQYGTYRRIFYTALKDLRAQKPDALILIDSPAFNLRFAKKARAAFNDLDILYYICPQIWAWGERRIRTVRQNVTKLFSILPFEVEFYKKHQIDCEFVGHPLLDYPRPRMEAGALRESLGIPSGTRAVGLLPGSRKKEVERILPIMLETASKLSARLAGLSFYVARSGNVPQHVYDEALKPQTAKVRFFEERFNEYVASFDFALVASGTATLQTALLGTPFFLLYKASWLTYFLGRQLIRVPYLGLVNLLAAKAVVPEFIQWNARPEVIAREAEKMLTQPDRLKAMRDELTRVCRKLGGQGASQKAAELMLNFLNRQAVGKETPAG